jgi:hypothetical protein
MKRLRSAVGNITRAARILNFRKIITTAPKRISPRMIPSMKSKYTVAGVIQGVSHTVTQDKKPADRRAAALTNIKLAANTTITAGNHHHLTSSGGLGNGPYHPGPKAPTGGPTEAGVGPKGPVGAATGADIVGATGITAGTLW